MRESACMTELRKIKEELSLQYLSMTKEERTAHSKEIRAWAAKQFGKSLIFVEPPPKEEPREPFDYNRLRDNYFENMTVEQVCEAVTEYKIKHNLETAT